MAGCVLKATYLGSHMEYTVDSPLGELFVIESRIAHPISAVATIAIRLVEHGVTLIPE